MGSAGSRQSDSRQTSLCLGRYQLADLAGNGALISSRFPGAGRRAPDDRFFMGRNLGSAGPDDARVDDLFELGARGVVKDDAR